jgi:hypothetical protein
VHIFCRGNVFTGIVVYPPVSRSLHSNGCTHYICHVVCFEVFACQRVYTPQYIKRRFIIDYECHSLEMQFNTGLVVSFDNMYLRLKHGRKKGKSTVQNKWWHFPVRPNPQHRSLFTAVSATSAPPFQPLRHQRNVCRPVVNRFKRQSLPSVKRKRFFMDILCTESFCRHKETHNRTLLFGSILFKLRSPFWLLKTASEHEHARLLPRL